MAEPKAYVLKTWREGGGEEEGKEGREGRTVEDKEEDKMAGHSIHFIFKCL